MQVSRAMDLKGHGAGVYHFSFSADCTRFVLVKFSLSERSARDRNTTPPRFADVHVALKTLGG